MDPDRTLTMPEHVKPKVALMEDPKQSQVSLFWETVSFFGWGGGGGGGAVINYWHNDVQE